MRIVLWASGALAALAVAGCADRFRPAALSHAPAARPARGAQERLRVSALPADLTWLADGLTLYREVDSSMRGSEETPERSPADRMSIVPTALPSPPLS